MFHFQTIAARSPWLQTTWANQMRLREVRYCSPDRRMQVFYQPPDLWGDERISVTCCYPQQTFLPLKSHRERVSIPALTGYEGTCCPRSLGAGINVYLAFQSSGFIFFMSVEIWNLYLQLHFNFPVKLLERWHSSSSTVLLGHPVP